MPSPTTTRWLTDVDRSTVEQVHRVVEAVVDSGGAVGRLHPPTPAEIESWLHDWRSAAAAGRGGLVLALVCDRIETIGGWRSGPDGPLGHVVELTKIMAHPRARGLGLGRLVVDALVDGARTSGAELLECGRDPQPQVPAAGAAGDPGGEGDGRQ